MKDNLDKPTYERSCCPIACALDQLGDKWTLLIIRDLLLGKRRYQELIASPEGMATNILADRLKKLEIGGIVVQRAYQQKPPRHEYSLTKKGEDLRPVLEALVKWGKVYYPGTMVFKPHEQRSSSKN